MNTAGAEPGYQAALPECRTAEFLAAEQLVKPTSQAGSTVCATDH